jgi:hypothetical protein
MRNNYRPSIFLTDGPSHIHLGGISIVGQEVKLKSCMLETRDSQLRIGAVLESTRARRGDVEMQQFSISPLAG